MVVLVSECKDTSYFRRSRASVMDFALKVEREDIAIAKFIAHTKRLHRFRHGHVSVEAVCDNEQRVGWNKETTPVYACKGRT
eukprot:scaffold110_cov315-Pavlova_lutheri.AAC.60